MNDSAQAGPPWTVCGLWPCIVITHNECAAVCSINGPRDRPAVRPACIHSSAALSTQHQFNISDSLSWKQLLRSQFIYNPILLGQIETDAFLPSLQKEFTVKCWTDLHSLA